ncbi:UCH-binding domain-containing protein [Phthorimaea operculella]|nr:UCH-binding domain-containing protein [Phthorimaea operculella]
MGRTRLACHPSVCRAYGLPRQFAARRVDAPNNMSQQQLMQLFGGVGQIGGLSSLLGTMGTASSRGGSVPRTTAAPATPATPATPAQAPVTPATPAAPARARDPPPATPPNTANATNPRSGQIFLSDLQRYFSGLGNAPPDADGAAAAGGAARVDLAAALASPEVVSTATTPGNAARLQPHLPAAPPGGTQDDAANLFSSALTSGQMGPVISQFGLPAEVAAAASSGNMQAFLKAMEDTANPDNKEGEDKKPADKQDDKDEKGDGKDGDDAMSLG